MLKNLLKASPSVYLIFLSRLSSTIKTLVFGVTCLFPKMYFLTLLAATSTVVLAFAAPNKQKRAARMKYVGINESVGHDKVNPIYCRKA